MFITFQSVCKIVFILWFFQQGQLRVWFIYYVLVVWIKVRLRGRRACFSVVCDKFDGKSTICSERYSFSSSQVSVLVWLVWDFVAWTEGKPSEASFSCVERALQSSLFVIFPYFTFLLILKDVFTIRGQRSVATEEGVYISSCRR